MDPTRLAAAVLTAALVAAPAARAQDGPPPEEAAAKKVLEKEASGRLSEGEAAAIKEKILLNCKKGGDCKTGLLEKTKPKKPKAGAGSAGAGPQPAAFSDGADGPGPDDGTDSVPSPLEGGRAEAARREAVEHRGRAMERAAGAADLLRRTLAEAEEEPAPERGASERGPGPSGGADAPRSVSELALAERSGYAETFRAQGLKVGAGPQGEVAIRRLDGAPASEAELSRLRAALRAEPEALGRRPDFFAVVTRAQFSELKEGYARRPGLRSTAFKHMALTAGGRDFQWAASCTPLSGDCNPVADGRPYRKGHDVSPEDLKEVWESLDAEDGGDDDEEWGEYTEEDRRLAEAEDLAAAKLAGPGRRLPALSSLMARLGGLARAAGAAFGPAPAGPVPGAVVGEAASTTWTAGTPGTEGREAEPAPGGSAAPPRRPVEPTAPLGPATPWRRRGLYLLAGAGAAAFLALGLRKRR